MSVIMFDTNEMKATIDRLNAQEREIEIILDSMDDHFRLERFWDGIDYVKFTAQVLIAMRKLKGLKSNIGNYADNLEYARKIYENANEQVANMISSLH